MINGTGDAGTPIGIAVENAAGIPSSQKVKSGNAASITYDGAYNTKKQVRDVYWPMATWLTHSSRLVDLRKLTYPGGQFVWQPSLQEGLPDRFDGHPIESSEFYPYSNTANSIAMTFGDFSEYISYTTPLMGVQRLVETSADRNAVEFIGRKYHFGAPTIGEAFALMYIGA